MAYLGTPPAEKPKAFGISFHGFAGTLSIQKIKGLIASLFWLLVLSGEGVAQTNGTLVPDAGSATAAGEALSPRAARAKEEEKRQNWEAAARNYGEASEEARLGGEYQRAISYGIKALAIGKKADNPYLQWRNTLRLVRAYRQVGQRQNVRALLNRGVEIIKQMPPGFAKTFNEASVYRELGNDFLFSGEAAKGIEYLSYSIQVLEIEFSYMRRFAMPQNLHNAQIEIVAGLFSLGTAYRRTGSGREALGAYEKAVGIIKTAGLQTLWESMLYAELGQLYLSEKDFGRAWEYLKKALELAEREQRNAHTVRDASTRLGDLLRQTNKPAEAINYYQKAIDSIESSRSLLASEELRSSFFGYNGVSYDGMILAHLDAHNIEEAFNYSERSRSRAFLDILGNKVKLARSGSVVDREMALKERIADLRAIMAREDAKSFESPQLQRELAEAEKAFNEFLIKVKQENLEQASLMSVEPRTLKQIQQMLEPGVTLLEYFVTSQKVQLWIVDKEGLNSVTIPLSPRELSSMVALLRESISQIEHHEVFKRQAEALYQLLIAPALPYIKGKEVLIIPHDVLHYVPFQALLSPHGKYLIEDFPIYYLSSASLMQFTREKKRRSRESALALGNPSLGDEAYNLRFAEREAKEIAHVYPRSTIFVKDQATKSKALTLSPNHDILHFAVHAEFNAQDPMSSALLLANDGNDDGRLKVGEVFSLDLKADLVVLSACETGLGKISSGDEIIGLTRAFIYAGTPSVVTTLWQVNDRASYELMREFYLNLKTMKKSEALRQAQLKTMKEFPRPFFWAAYGLTGEP